MKDRNLKERLSSASSIGSKDVSDPKMLCIESSGSRMLFNAVQSRTRGTMTEEAPDPTLGAKSGRRASSDSFRAAYTWFGQSAEPCCTSSMVQQRKGRRATLKNERKTGYVPSASVLVFSASAMCGRTYLKVLLAAPQLWA